MHGHPQLYLYCIALHNRAKTLVPDETRKILGKAQDVIHDSKDKKYLIYTKAGIT